MVSLACVSVRLESFFFFFFFVCVVILSLLCQW